MTTWSITINMKVEIVELEKPVKVKPEPITPKETKPMPVLQPVSYEPKFYTCAQVAEMLNIKKQLIWKWIRDGKLTAVNFGREYRIREEDLNTCIEANLNKKTQKGA